MSINPMKSKKILVVLSLILTFGVCSPVRAEQIDQYKSSENIEVFSVPTFNPETGDEIGFKNVNSSLIMHGDTISIMTAVVKQIEDYYDLNGTFINSLVTYSESSNDFKSGKATDRTDQKKFSLPKAILITHKDKPSKNTERLIPDVDEAKVKNNIDTIFSKIDITNKYTKKEGITYNQIMQIQKNISMYDFEQAPNITPFGVLQQAGAFDNYYNLDTATGKFTVQALISMHKYYKVTGSTIGQAINASTVNSFKTIIDDYERTVIKDMEGASFGEVANWIMTLGSGVLLVAGFASGPPGWAAIFSTKTIAEMVIFFGSFTSASYTTISRTNLSYVAANKEIAAFNKIWGNSNWNISSVTTAIVDGY